MTTITAARPLNIGGLGSNGVTSQIGWRSVIWKWEKKRKSGRIFIPVKVLKVVQT